MKSRKQINSILDERDLLLMNAFSFYADMEKKDFANLMEEAAKRGKEMEQEAKDLLLQKYKQAKNKKIAKFELHELLQEDDLPLEVYTELMFIVLEKRRELNLEE